MHCDCTEVLLMALHINATPNVGPTTGTCHSVNAVEWWVHSNTGRIQFEVLNTLPLKFQVFCDKN